MGLTIGFLAVTIFLPLVILGFRRNFRTLIIGYAPLLFAAYLYGRKVCVADRISEACTWAYMYYFYALFVGSMLYLLVTAIQWMVRKADSTKRE